jgi:hypothetical protein
MTEQAVGLAAAALLKHYSFDLGGYSTDQLVQHWLDHYPAIWLRMAIVEALYQGRYKAVSVDQILTLWHRRAQPVCHYNHEFERMICNRFPRNLLKNEDEPGFIVLADVGGVERSVGLANEAAPMASDGADSADPTNTNTATNTAQVSSDAKALHHPDAIAPRSEPVAIEPMSNDAQITTFAPANYADTASFTETVSRDDAIRQPIHQFVPSGDTSEFYTKMRGVSFADEEFIGTPEGISRFN